MGKNKKDRRLGCLWIFILLVILVFGAINQAQAQGGYGPWVQVYAEPKTCDSGWNPVELTDDYINGYYNRLDKINDYDLYAWLEFVEWDIRYNGLPTDSWKPVSRKTIVFRHLDGPIGIATGMFDEGRIEIQIDVDYWKKLNKMERLFLIYHEVSHDYWEVWHNEVTMLSPALSIIKNDISRRKFLEWRNELFKYVADKNAKRNGECPLEEGEAQEPVTTEEENDNNDNPPSCNH